MNRINLDIDKCAKLRNKINEYQHYSITKTHSIKNDEKGKSWNKICAIMDRLDDTTYYLNNLDLKEDETKLAIFNFYNFMNHSATLIDCINLLAEIFDVDFSNENSSTVIFNKKGPDKSYFEYLRSLCSVHPIKTSHHKIFQDPNTNVECSPFSIWNHGFKDDDSEIVIVVYTDGKEHSSKYIGVQFQKLFGYVSLRFNMLDKLIEGIDLYYQKVIKEFQMQPIKTYKDFSDYLDYIDYLKVTYNERVNNGYDEYFDYYKSVFTTSFNNESNNIQLKKYQNAIKYGITFLQKYLEILPNTDTFETTGLKEQPLHTTGDSLFFQLQSCEAGDFRYKHMYAFEKLSLMNLQPKNMDMADSLLKEIKDFWEKYLIFEDNMNATQVTIFINIASYFWRLEHDSYFSNNIPKDVRYR